MYVDVSNERLSGEGCKAVKVCPHERSGRHPIDTPAD